MRYGEVIGRSFSIFWRHKYLWLLGALGGGEAVGGAGGGGSFGNAGDVFGGRGGAAGGTAGGDEGEGAFDFAQVLSHWFTANLPLLAVLLGLLVIFVLGYFLLSCITTGATIRAAAEHDAERPFSFRLAWRTGLSTFLAIFGLRLLGMLFAVVVLALYGVLVLIGLTVNLWLAIALGILLFIGLIPAGIGFSLVMTLATRSVVLERRGALRAVGRGFDLLKNRLGPVLLLWLIAILLGLAIGAAVGVVSLVILVPVGLILAVGYFSGGVEGLLTIGAVLLLVYVVLTILLSGAAGSYLTTYWTLAFRRLQVEPTPQPAHT